MKEKCAFGVQTVIKISLCDLSASKCKIIFKFQPDVF